MKKLILFTLMIFVSLRHYTAKKPLMSVILQKCTSYCNPEYCKMTRVCRPLNRTSKLVSLDIYIHPGIALNSSVNIQIQTFKKFATVYRPFMIKVKGDLCKELSKRTHPLFSLSKNKTCAGNLCDPCPLAGHRHITRGISNAYDNVYDQMPILPAGEWSHNIEISHERNGSEVVVAWWTDYYEVKALTAEQF